MENRMIKKIIIYVTLCFLLLNNIWAQEQPRKILTEQDVINLAENYEKISEELDKINFKLNVDDFSSFPSVDEAMSTIKDVNALNKILNKYGISDPEPVRKVVVIVYALVIEIFSREAADNPEFAMLMQMMSTQKGDPLSKVRKSVNPADLALVQKHYDKYKEYLE
jgi:flagellar biosynthesis/type III secretory pathway protein FliH